MKCFVYFKKKRFTGLIFILFFNLAFAFSQDIDSLSPAQDFQAFIQPEKLIFAYRHNTFLASTFVGRPRILRVYGEVDLQSKFGFGFSFTWLHTYNFSPQIGLETGFQAGGLPIRYRFLLEFSPPTEDYPEYATEYIEYLSFPIQLNLRKKIKPQLFLSLHPGLSLRYILIESLSWGTTRIKNDNTRERLFRMESGFENKFRFTYTLGIGLSRLVWRKDFVNLRLTYTYSPRNIMYGAYIFYPDASGSDPLKTEGTFRTNGSHLGLSVGYTFTKVRKMMKRLKKEKN